MKFVSYQQPINLAYLAAAAIGAGFNAEIWDYGIGKFIEKDFVDRVSEYNPSIIGIHCKTFNIMQGHRLAGVVKRYFSGIKIVIGGPHSSALPLETLDEFPNFDIVVVGEGEVTIAELCREISSENNLRNIKGLAFRENETAIFNGTRELIQNLDAVEYPARHLLQKNLYNRRHPTRGI